MPLTQFGTAPAYDFTAAYIHLGRYSDNFRQLDNKTSALPGAVGVFDEQGRGVSSQGGGTVQQEVTLVARSRAQMTDRRDALDAMAGWGKQQLVMQPSDSSDSIRFCEARILDISYDKEEAMYSDLHQPVTLTWAVDYPRWLGQGNTGDLWGVAVWGTSVWPGTLVSASGLVTETTITNNGNAITHPRITVDSSGSAYDTTIQRVVNGVVVDQVRHVNALLSAGESLVIDPRTLSVTLDGSDAFDSTFSYTHPAWFRLLPGENTIRIRFGFSWGAGDVTFLFNDAYYGAG